MMRLSFAVGFALDLDALEDEENLLAGKTIPARWAARHAG